MARTAQSSATHTPGPWIAESFDRYVREEATGGTIAQICKDDGHVDAKTRQPMPFDANARLIAAAPDLLQALRNLVACFDTTSPDHEAFWEGEAESAAYAERHITSDQVRERVLAEGQAAMTKAEGAAA